jgi:hypothetical protein
MNLTALGCTELEFSWLGDTWSSLTEFFVFSRLQMTSLVFTWLHLASLHFSVLWFSSIASPLSYLLLPEFTVVRLTSVQFTSLHFISLQMSHLTSSMTLSDLVVLHLTSFAFTCPKLSSFECPSLQAIAITRTWPHLFTWLLLDFKIPPLTSPDFTWWWSAYFDVHWLHMTFYDFTYFHLLLPSFTWLPWFNMTQFNLTKLPLASLGFMILWLF